MKKTEKVDRILIHKKRLVLKLFIIQTDKKNLKKIGLFFKVINSQKNKAILAGIKTTELLKDKINSMIET